MPGVIMMTTTTTTKKKRKKKSKVDHEPVKAMVETPRKIYIEAHQKLPPFDAPDAIEKTKKTTTHSQQLCPFPTAPKCQDRSSV